MSEQNTKDQKTEERSVDGRAVGHQTKKSRFYAVMRSIFARIMLGLFRVEIVDAENEPQDSCGFIVCSNHISAADPILIVASLRNQVHFVAKAELFHVPLLGLIIRAFGAYPIKRGAADVGAIKRTVELLRGGQLFFQSRNPLFRGGLQLLDFLNLNLDGLLLKLLQLGLLLLKLGLQSIIGRLRLLKPLFRGLGILQRLHLPVLL